MSYPGTLNEYIQEIRDCEDKDRLYDQFKIYDNWPILLYGHQDELFSKVVSAFRDSPKSDGIRDPWRYVGERSLDRDQWGILQPALKDSQMLHFVHLFGAEVQVFNRTGSHLGYYEKEHRINDQDHSVFLLFHGTHSEEEQKVHWIRGVALAVASFGDYIIRKNLTARFPKYGLNLNFIPTLNLMVE